MRSYDYSECAADINRFFDRNLLHFDAIAAIARGGLTPAHFIAMKLDIREIYTINAHSYDGQNRGVLTLSNTPDSLQAKKILLVDDISDSGNTFIASIESLRKQNSEITIKTFALFYKPTSAFKPDYYLQESEEWIEFFWEREFKSYDSC